MFCPNCDSENLESAKFCKNCGERFFQIQNKITQNESRLVVLRRKRNNVVIGIVIIVILLVIGTILVKQGWRINPPDKNTDTLQQSASQSQQTPASAVNNVASDASCGSQVKDADGNTYGTVLVGMQCWMTSNMVTSTYPDGTKINQGPDKVWDGTDHGYFSYSSNVDATGEETLSNIKSEKLGFLYQWRAAMHGSTMEGAQGICPTGWHVPTDREQYTLENYLKDSGETCDANRENDKADDCASSGTKLKFGGSSGLNFPLAGFRNSDGGFYSDPRTLAYFWSSTSRDSSAWIRHLDPNKSGVGRILDMKEDSNSVRCIKD